ncbi:MAG: corrinoid protein [Planctomycetia bacterium]|nr:corrinoid protein [Planctomycetia bacterium]
MSELFTAVVKGDIAGTIKEVNKCIAEGIAPKSILEEHLIPAMGEVGRLFDEDEYFVPDLMLSSNAMKEAMKILDPHLKQSGTAKRGTVLIGTVQGDMHDIGKNLVASMLEGNGFAVKDLGISTSADKFIQEIRKSEGESHLVLALSALLTTTMPQMKKLIDRLQTEGLRDSVKIMIGGAPVSEEYSREIGADGYSDSAYSAVQLAIKLVS